ncbi:hypothetical protein [Jiulongibacter sp. NS-SX5]|uniref:hypothetical protein n=1 Tax=Jiulongibacter sp. NS-SX5 TaxID=3463854 RepID=UPI0040595361
MTRPTFLTVLCILTFIGSGYGIFNAITSYTNAEVAVGLTGDVMEEAMDQIEDEADTEQEAKMATKIMGAVTDGLTVENIQNMSIANGISALLCLLGAILMWSLDKKGFWLYVIGTAVGVIAPLMIYKGLLGAMAGGGMAFIGILFVVLYALNLKHLR